MKLTVFTFFTCLINLSLFSPTNAHLTHNSSLPMCVTENRCTGSSSCNTCTDCSRCGFCNNGGSCGVCAGGSPISPSMDLLDFNNLLKKEKEEKEKRAKEEMERMDNMHREIWRRESEATKFIEKMAKAGYVSESHGYKLVLDKYTESCVDFHDKYSLLKREKIERRLSQLGYEILDIDGSFDALTISSIKQFQELQRLKPDGKIGDVTFNRLFPDVGYVVTLSKIYFVGKWKDESSIFEFNYDGTMSIRFIADKVIKNGTWQFEDNILTTNLDIRTLHYKLISYNENLFNFQSAEFGGYYQAKRL